MNPYDPISIDYSKVNNIRINNLVYFNQTIWKIYDIENDVLYLKNPDKSNVGALKNEISPVLITTDIMELCGFAVFSIEDDNQYYIGKDIIQTKVVYQLKKPQYDIDLKFKIVTDYKLDKNNQFILANIGEVDLAEKKMRWLHQVQNAFFDLYKIELVDII